MQWRCELVERVLAVTAHQLFPRLRSKSQVAHSQNVSFAEGSSET
jgi:hypothetical protein